MRGVADTNTVVSALLCGGAPADILRAAREQRISLFTSAALIAELEEVLAREKFAARITKVGSTVADLIAGYRELKFVAQAEPRLAHGSDRARKFLTQGTMTMQQH